MRRAHADPPATAHRRDRVPVGVSVERHDDGRALAAAETLDDLARHLDAAGIRTGLLDGRAKGLTHVPESTVRLVRRPNPAHPRAPPASDPGSPRQTRGRTGASGRRAGGRTGCRAGTGLRPCPTRGT